MNGFGGDVSLCLPFSLMHSKPTDDSDNQRGQNAQNARTIRAELKTTEPPPTEPPAKNVESKIEEPNLITFDDPSSSKLVQPLPNPAVLQGMSHKSIITSSEKVLGEVISVKKTDLMDHNSRIFPTII